MTSQERLLKFEAENDDLSLRTSHLDCQIAIRRLLDDLAAAREDVARMDKALRRIATMECHSEGGLPVTPSELREIARAALAAYRAALGGTDGPR